MDKLSGFVPLTLARVEGGEFIDEGDLTFRHLQERLLNYVRRYAEKGGAKGATATMTLKVAIKVTDADEGAFCVSTDIKAAVPQKPKRETLAISHPQADGFLVCRDDGTDEDPPEQSKFDFVESGPGFGEGEREEVAG